VFKYSQTNSKYYQQHHCKSCLLVLSFPDEADFPPSPHLTTLFHNAQMSFSSYDTLPQASGDQIYPRVLAGAPFGPGEEGYAVMSEFVHSMEYDRDARYVPLVV
jgi:hypothetical protein